MNVWLEQLALAAVLPAPVSTGSFGYDLSADEEVTIAPRAVELIPTGLRLARNLPFQRYWVSEFNDERGIVPGSSLRVAMTMMILPRSSLFKRRGLIIPNSPGLVDADYAGEIFVQVLNLRDEPTTVEYQERVAQLVFTMVGMPPLAFTEDIDHSRTRGGFGSTGA